MNGELWEVATHLPSVRRFLGAVVRDLATGRNVVVLLPPAMDAELVDEFVHEQLHQKDCYYYVLDTTKERGVPLCAASLAKMLSIDLPRDQISFADLMRHTGCPEVVRLDGIGRLPQELRDAWLKLVKEWSQAARLLAGEEQRTKAVCIVEHALDLMGLQLSSDVNLTLHWWWGFPSAMELRLLCRELTGSDPAMAAWHECLVAGIAAGDIELANELLSKKPVTFAEVVAMLQEFPRPKEFSEEVDGAANGILAFTRGNLEVNDFQPPERLRSAWAAGGVVCSDEYGPEVHPSVLAVDGKKELLERRVWRGQAEALLHRVDRIRLSVCLDLRHYYGERWFERLGMTPQTQEEQWRLDKSALDAELGYLVALSRGGRISNRSWQWDVPLSISHRVRNQLAHYKPLDLEQFRTSWEAIVIGRH